MSRFIVIVCLVSCACVAGLVVAMRVPEGAPALKGPFSQAAPKAITMPMIDGKLDDPCWAQAVWSDPFVDIEGAEKPKPLYATRVKMVWDDQGLYIAARLEEPHLQGTLKYHDSYIFHADNDFEVFIDPDGDCHDYGELELNALGTTWDLLLTKPYRNGGRALDSWEIKGLRVAIGVEGTLNNPTDTDTAWTVEIAIPWRSLGEIGGGVPRPGDRWRINFSRVEWQWDEAALKQGKYVKKANQPEANWVWSSQAEINMHLPDRWGSVVFVNAGDGMKPLPTDDTAMPRMWLGRFHQAWLTNPQTDANRFKSPIVLPGEWQVSQTASATSGGHRYSVVTLRHTDGRTLSIDHTGRIGAGKAP